MVMFQKNGQCEFSQKNLNFIIEFSELLSSLGIKHSIKKNQLNVTIRIVQLILLLSFVINHFNALNCLEKKND